MNHFYVYCLFRPWNLEPCYIGKGHGHRIGEHFTLGAKHYNKHLASIIKMSDREIPAVILHENLDEKTAFEYEKAFIAAIGRADRGKGPLCNWTDGGDGVSGFTHRPESKAAMSAKRMGNKYSLGTKQSDETKQKKVESRRSNQERDADSRIRQGIGMAAWHASLSEEERLLRNKKLSETQLRYYANRKRKSD